MVIILESDQIFKCNLLDTWPKSSSVNSVNLVKKICYNSRDIEFFLGDCFLLVHPVYTIISNYYVNCDFRFREVLLGNHKSYLDVAKIYQVVI